MVFLVPAFRLIMTVLARWIGANQEKGVVAEDPYKQEHSVGRRIALAARDKSMAERPRL